MIPFVATKAVGAIGPTALSVLRNVGKTMVAARAGGTLTGYSSIGRLEPIALIDESLRRNTEIVTPLAQICQSIITAYFLRAVSLHNISIGGVSVAKQLEPYSTNRDPYMAAGLSLTALEGYEDKLVFANEQKEYPKFAIESLEGTGNTRTVGSHQFTRTKAGTFTHKRIAAVESYVVNNGPLVARGSNRQDMRGTTMDVESKNIPDFRDRIDQANKNLRIASSGQSNVSGFEYRQVADITDASSLITGKLVNVTLKHGQDSATVPVGVRLNCKWLAPEPMVAILGGAKDIRFGTRWKQFVSQEISWKDFITSQDLIDEHKRTLKADKTGVYLGMLQRRQGNAASAAMSGVPSMNNASSVYIMSAETAAQIELRMGGSLDNFQTRQALFSHGYGMLLAIVNMRMGSVTLYTRDIPEYTEVDFSELKSSSKRDGPDIGDILSAFRAGNSMRL